MPEDGKQDALNELLTRFDEQAPELAEQARSVPTLPATLPLNVDADVSTGSETKQSGIGFLGTSSS